MLPDANQNNATGEEYLVDGTTFGRLSKISIGEIDYIASLETPTILNPEVPDGDYTITLSDGDFLKVTTFTIADRTIIGVRFTKYWESMTHDPFELILSEENLIIPNGKTKLTDDDTPSNFKNLVLVNLIALQQILLDNGIEMQDIVASFQNRVLPNKAEV